METKRHRGGTYTTTPRSQDQKTTRHRDSKIRETKTLRHWETETIKPRHRDSKAFFQRTKSYDIGIPRLKSHDIEIPGPRNHDLELLLNSDPYAPWYSSRGAYLPRLFRTRRAPLSKFPSLRKQQCSIRYQAFFKKSAAFATRLFLRSRAFRKIKKSYFSGFPNLKKWRYEFLLSHHQNQ